MIEFDELFEEEWDPDHSENFGLSTVVAADVDRNELIDALAIWVAANKTDPIVTADLLAAAGWEVAGAALATGRISVKRGDFGEVLAVEAVEGLDALVVPIRKLRYQIDPNQTLPGADIVALDIDEDGDIDELQFTESKYRTNPSSGIIVEALDQLEEDRERQFATTLNFLAHRLRETDLELYERFMAYLGLRKKRSESYSVCLTCDADNLSDGPVEAVDGMHRVMEPLMLRVIALADATEFIDAVCAKLNYELDSTDD